MLSVTMAFAHLTQVHLGAVLCATVLSRICSRLRLGGRGCHYKTILRIKDVAKINLIG